MTTSGAPRAQHRAGARPAPSAQGEPHRTARRLTDAAADSPDALIAEAAALAGGWAALVDVREGVLHCAPPGAAPAALEAARHPNAHPRTLLRRVDGAVLVLAPGDAVSEADAALVAESATGLIKMRSRATDEVEQRVHTAALRLLLNGHHQLATELLGHTTAPTHATVYRLTGPAPAVRAAHRDLWHKTRRSGTSGASALICLHGADLAVTVLHDADHDPHPMLAQMARVADRHQLTGGVCDPTPVDMLPAGWAEAATARNGAELGCLTTALGAQGLLHTVPRDRLTTWSAAVLRPLGHDQRRTLDAWLRTGSAQAAAPALGISPGTIRARLTRIGTLLAADLDHPTVQAQLLLALRSPTSPPASRTARLRLTPPLPAELFGPDDASRWAHTLLAPLNLDTRLRITLRCWLHHHGRTAPTAVQLGVHRGTLTAWLSTCRQLLDLDLSSPTVRAELHLATETLATPDDVPARLPRRGGRTYRPPPE